MNQEVQRGRELVHSLRLPLSILKNAIALMPKRASKALIHFHATSDGYTARAVRFAALKAIVPSCGELVDLRAFCRIISPEKLRLGSRISIHPYTYIDATGVVEIGNDVSIAHGSSILSSNHTWADPEVPIRDQPVTFERTRIEDGVWIGAGCRILSGVTLGEGSVVAAGAVVTKDVTPRTVVAGVPARPISDRSRQE